MYRTRALAVVLAVGFSAARPGTGGQSEACENRYPAEVPYRLTLPDSTDTSDLVSDGRDYLHDQSACMEVADHPLGFFALAHPNAPRWPECRNRMTRSFRIDLSHPVPGGGGESRGVITDSRPHLQIHTRLDSTGKNVGLQGMRIGETTKARYIAIAATDHQLRIYFNPEHTCPTRLVLARGSTQGMVTRRSATRWEIELPEGSMGRLLEGAEGRERQDRGLYYFRTRLIVDSR